jgi:hypothetical protein
MRTGEAPVTGAANHDIILTRRGKFEVLNGLLIASRIRCKLSADRLVILDTNRRVGIVTMASIVARNKFIISYRACVIEVG